MEELVTDKIEKDFTLCPAATILLGQINKRWPDREKDFDNNGINEESLDNVEDHTEEDNGKIYALDIDIRMGPKGKMRDGLVADELASQIINYVKNGIPGSERIKSVSYKNKTASGEFKDRFWIWRNTNSGCANHIHIAFKNLGYEDPRQFQLPIFKTKDEDPKIFTPKVAVEVPKYPGKEKLVFGQSSQTIVRLQKQLMAKNYPLPLGQTGEYDEQTRAAIRLLYHKMRKNSNGKEVGPAAWKFLFGE